MRVISVLIAVAVAFTGSVDATAKAGHHHHKKHHRHHAKKKHAKPKPAPAPAPAPKPQLKPTSFDGTCEFSGAVTFTPAMTTNPQAVKQHANAPGTCTGSFVDGYGGTHKLDNSPATYLAESGGDSVSCAFGTATGTGKLVFQYGELAFEMHEYRVAATPMIELTGKDGGDAWMPVTPSQSADPVAAVQACNAGGLDKFELDAHLRTNGAIRG